MSIFDQIVTQAETCRTCEELQRLVAQAVPPLEDLLSTIAAAQAQLAAAQELVSLNPTDLPGVVSFLAKFKTDVLGPQLAAYAKVVSANASTVAGITSVTSALNAAATRIGNCPI